MSKQTRSHRTIASHTKSNARKMRVLSTNAESVMWRFLRDRRLQSFKFRRQVPFQNYILDFVCYEKMLVVEIDGGQHSENLQDQIRDRLLAAKGFKTVRYWNNDVIKNAEGVLMD